MTGGAPGIRRVPRTAPTELRPSAGLKHTQVPFRAPPTASLGPLGRPPTARPPSTPSISSGPFKEPLQTGSQTEEATKGLRQCHKARKRRHAAESTPSVPPVGGVKRAACSAGSRRAPGRSPRRWDLCGEPRSGSRVAIPAWRVAHERPQTRSRPDVQKAERWALSATAPTSCGPPTEANVRSRTGRARLGYSPSDRSRTQTSGKEV